MDEVKSYFGPYLRFGSCHPKENTWTGSIMVVEPPLVGAAPVVTISGAEVISQDIQGQLLQTILGFKFWKYPMVLDQQVNEQEIKYFVYKPGEQDKCENSFFVPKIGAMCHWAAQSCSGYSSHVNQAQWGGVAPLWKDLLGKHDEKPFHLVVGGGDQIYCDSVFKTPELEAWMSKLDKGAMPDKAGLFTEEIRGAAERYLLELYLSHFSEEGLREALARIPHLMIWDDHDIFDGWGSYPDRLQNCSVFQGLFVLLRQYYLLFQHHTTFELTQQPSSDLFGNGETFSYLRYLGNTTALVGPDIRGERTLHRVMSAESWDMLFDRMADIPTTIEHVVMVLTVPLIFPKVPFSESLMKILAALNRWTYLHKLLYVTGMSKKLLKFNEPDLLDDLWDHFKSMGHEDDRRRLVLRTQEFARNHGVRVSYVCGDVHCCGVGRFFTRPKVKESVDPHMMKQIITSGIVNEPQKPGILRLLNFFDTDVNDINGRTGEQMVPMFHDHKVSKLMGRRNWCEVTEADEVGCEKSLKFTIWTEDPKNIGKDLQPYCCLVPPLLPGYSEVPEEEENTYEGSLKACLPKKMKSFRQMRLQSHSSEDQGAHPSSQVS